jgi:lysophospholipase L1-like esterase
MNSSPDTLWVATAATALGVTIQNLSVSGTGYLTGDGLSKPDTFVTRASKIDADTVETVFFGSRNDLGRDRSEVSAAAAAAFAAAREAAPSSALVVVGPPWVDSEPTDSIMNYRNTLRAAAADAQIPFYDPIAERWFFDNPELIGKDTVHPTDAGHQYLARKLIPIIEGNIHEQ